MKQSTPALKEQLFSPMPLCALLGVFCSLGSLSAFAQGTGPADRDKVVFESAEIFPLLHQHVHGSTVVELPNGDLLAVFSGDRTAHVSPDVRPDVQLCPFCFKIDRVTVSKRANFLIRARIDQSEADDFLGAQGRRQHDNHSEKYKNSRIHDLVSY